MINTAVIILKDPSVLKELELSFVPPPSITVSFEIDAIETLKALSLTTFFANPLFDQSHIYFTFYFNFDHLKDEYIQFEQHIINKKEVLLQCFFHPQYKRNGDCPILFFKDSRERYKEIVSILNKYVRKQGYHEFFPVYFKEGHFNRYENYAIFFSDTTSKAISEVYAKLLKEHYSSNFIGIKSDNYKAILLSMIQTEDRMRMENQELFFHLERYDQLNKELLIANRNLMLANEDLQNHRTYLNIFKNQDESMKINNFYYHEYEVLPLWYKKFGHILKVVMGKRSFRSLFDNNTTKYKD